MGLVVNKLYDAFLSYAHDDNVLNDDVVWHFRDHPKRKLEAEIRRRLTSHPRGDAEVYMDLEGLPSNGGLSKELGIAAQHSLFLIIFIGRSYPDSEWCGQELDAFVARFNGDRQKAIEHTFVVVLEKEAERSNWGAYLEKPERPIVQRFYDDLTGDVVPPILEGKGGRAVPSPRFSGRLRKIVETMTDRVIALQTEGGLPEAETGPRSIL